MRQSETENENQFYNVKQAIQYLTRMGWKISNKSFYRHISQGWVSSKPWSRLTLDDYAEERLHPTEKTTVNTRRKAVESADLRQAQIERARASAEYARMRTEQLKGNFIPRDEHLKILAGRALLYKNTLTNYSYNLAAHLRHKLGRDETFFWDIHEIIIRDIERHFKELFELPFIDLHGDGKPK